jgi:dTDP-4-dehydrorhamnose reductase
MINATGFVRVDDAETNREECFRVNAHAPGEMAAVCNRNGIRFITFSTDLVFDGSKQEPYLESDTVRSLNVYGSSKLAGEQLISQVNKDALVIRSSCFFGPWDKYNFVYDVLQKISRQEEYAAAGNVIVSPTYIPDLVNTTLDLLIDEETGIWHVSNNGMYSWYELAQRVACANGQPCDRIIERTAKEMNWVAQRPLYSVLRSGKGITLPAFDSALERYFLERTA